MKKIKLIFCVLCVGSIFNMCYAYQNHLPMKYNANSKSKKISVTYQTHPKIKSDVEKVVLHFHVGDSIPVKFHAEGDLIQTNYPEPVYVQVKRDFYIKVTDDGMLLSFDGEHFKPIKKAISGTLNVSAAADENGTSVDVDLKALLK